MAASLNITCVWRSAASSALCWSRNRCTVSASTVRGTMLLTSSVNFCTWALVDCAMDGEKTVGGEAVIERF
jgi:hypothetical protein